MALRMQHERYGTRTIEEDQEPGYLATRWTRVPETAVDGTVKQVLAAVGDDPLLARTALEAEQAKPDPRTSLVSALEPIAAATDDTTSEV